MKILAVIPARYASTRLPGKPLSDIHGKPMVQWVYERAIDCSMIHETVVATDDQRILDAVKAFGGKAVMTSPDHISGTDRIREAVGLLGSDADLIINVQGDEPALEKGVLETLISLFKEGVDIGTLITPFKEVRDFNDPNKVKAAVAEDGRALYFSRSPIPYDRANPGDFGSCFQHLGVYGYRRSVLMEVTSLVPSPLEKKESLEQLRWLENGYRIYAAAVDKAPIGVDTQEDLERVRKLLS